VHYIMHEVQSKYELEVTTQ